jgi:hypothetical protein
MLRYALTHISIGKYLRKVAEGWRKFHNELQNFYYPPNIFRVIKWRDTRGAEHVACMVKRHANKMLVGKHEGKRPLGRPRCRSEDNIKMDLKHMVWVYGLHLCGSVCGPVAGSCEHGNGPSGSINCEFLVLTIGYSSRILLHRVS